MKTPPDWSALDRAEGYLADARRHLDRATTLVEQERRTLDSLAVFARRVSIVRRRQTFFAVFGWLAITFALAALAFNL